MKKQLTCFFALMLVVPGVFATDGTISRAIPTTGEAPATNNTTRTVTTGNMPARTAVSRVFSGGGADGLAQSRTGGVVSRSVVASKSDKGSAHSTLENTVNTVGRNERVSKASINNNPIVRRAGLTLRPSTAEVGGRATIGDTGIQTGSNLDDVVRGVKSRAASNMTAEDITQATTRLEQTATLNKSCQAQYNECMDQFCAVIDANQGRCSCSSNLAQYTKVEEAVKEANTQLNEVAQLIRYVGLSADEIRAIMTETEAEEALSSATDTSETRNMLEEIEDLIRDPSSGSAYYSDTSINLDMDLDFSSEADDIFSLDFLDTGGNTSFSNLRGRDLYNAAKKRCNTVLNQCKGAGATIAQVTGNYDLAIDKDCIAYEQGLKKMNETLVSNVRSANRMLQKARLAVLQNKNQYDAKGCIGALETCMKDDMVCGDDYFKCVDPTKVYIDENGDVVLGQKISNITAFMTGYNNAKIDKDFLSNAYSSQNVDAASCSADPTGSPAIGGNDGSCVAKYLLQKIGTKQNVTDEGLCRAVLDKCQRYTYNSSGEYNPYNDIVVNYVQRALVNIRAAQHRVIADYASNCMVDIAQCYNQQVSQVNSWSSNASVNSIYNIMRGACRNVALTCAYAVFDGEAICTNSQGQIVFGENNCQGIPTYNQPDEYINAISEMFYQSLLCPDNSMYQQTEYTGQFGNGTRYINSRCMCNQGYEAWGELCVVVCPDNSTRNTYGSCVCDAGYTMVNNVCQSSSDNSDSNQTP
ncbi:MAG: hypothetical protein R8N50_02180 [Alphaproteobacteria bacterium]|nr:hypothetical protein [Alphaproteobacteria bacterium]